LSRNSIDITRALPPTWWIAALLLLVAELLQVTIFHRLVIRNVEMSIVLVTVVWYASRVDLVYAGIFGLAAGLIEDSLSGHTGAAWTISTTTVALATSALSRGFFADSHPLVATITVAATLVRDLLFWVVMGFEGYPSGLAGIHTREAFFQSILNALLMMVALWVSRRVRERYA
jgi:rod shape-determining protein MreD